MTGGGRSASWVHFREMHRRRNGGIEDTKTREGLAKTYLAMMDDLANLAERGLGGSIYTQTTDVEIEVNGLMTYDRKVLKFDPAALKKAHAEIIRKANNGL